MVRGHRIRTLGPVPIPILIAAAVVPVFIFLLTQTPFGRHVYAVGANEEAAQVCTA